MLNAPDMCTCAREFSFIFIAFIRVCFLNYAHPLMYTTFFLRYRNHRRDSMLKYLSIFVSDLCLIPSLILFILIAGITTLAHLHPRDTSGGNDAETRICGP